MSVARPTLTIVTPSYNQGTFIGQTIESVLSQSGDFEIEYLVMDGGSTDESPRIIGDFAARIAAGTWPINCAGISMHWVSRPDHGQTDAINQGLRRATGDIIGWINSDDTYVPGAFARIATAFARHSTADFIYGDGEVIDQRGDVQWPWLSRPYDVRVLMSYHFLWNDFTNYVMQQSTFWRRSVMDRIGFLDESFHYGMDIEYWVRAGVAGLTLQHIPETIARFRLIEGTKSLSSLTAFWPDYLEIFRRYRGARHLAGFLAFYYYNLARQLAFDPAETVAAKTAVLRRWSTLPKNEQEELVVQANRGFRLGCFLSARDLLARGDIERANRFIKAAGGITWTDCLHPFAWPYGVRRWLTPGVSSVVESAAQAAIRKWRRHLYDYRYHQLRRNGSPATPRT
jgi:glycosyltransferase involved in cell wall biosynthesis